MKETSWELSWWGEMMSWLSCMRRSRFSSLHWTKVKSSTTRGLRISVFWNLRSRNFAERRVSCRRVWPTLKTSGMFLLSLLRLELPVLSAEFKNCVEVDFLWTSLKHCHISFPLFEYSNFNVILKVLFLKHFVHGVNSFWNWFTFTDVRCTTFSVSCYVRELAAKL